MKRLSKIFTIIAFSFCFLVFNFNFVSAGFSEYNSQIKTTGYSEAENKCTSECPSDDGVKYYQLTTGVPFLGANAVRCACVPVSSGIQFFLTSIMKFVLGSVATITTIIIIVAGFRWAFSAGNKKIISDSKNMIKNAIVGLIMSLTSGLMLKVINPKLLSMDVLKVSSVNIAPATNVCGNIKSDFAKNRNNQLCRLSNDNAFTAGGVNFALSWSICDINGENCGNAQELNQDNISKYNQNSDGMITACANINDNFGRFSIKISSISNISKDLVFDCATDDGVESIKIKSTVGTYGMCRATGDNTASSSDYCASNKNTYCNVKKDSICVGEKIGVVKLNEKSSVLVKDVSNTRFSFNCTVIRGNYGASDFEICNSSGVCTNGVSNNASNLGERYNANAIDLIHDTDMRFGIKFNIVREGDFTIKCNSVNGKQTEKEFSINSKIIEKVGVNKTFNLCLGGWDACGVAPYNEVNWNFIDYGVYKATRSFDCDKFKTESYCNGYNIGGVSVCSWNGSDCKKNY